MASLLSRTSFDQSPSTFICCYPYDGVRADQLIIGLERGLGKFWVLATTTGKMGPRRKYLINPA